jgi:hypothetical protein
VTTVLFEGILSALELVVLERMPHGIFLRVGTAPAPEWFGQVVAAAAGEVPATIAQAFPFVDHFLDEAEFFWRQGRTGRVRSEPFIIKDANGAEVCLVASAVVVGHRHLLVIESTTDFDDRRRALQSARETVMEHEAHVRRTRALLTRIQAARTLTAQLANSGLTSDQAPLAVEVAEQLSTLAGAVEELAPLPKGVTSGQGR